MLDVNDEIMDDEVALHIIFIRPPITDDL